MRPTAPRSKPSRAIDRGRASRINRFPSVAAVIALVAVLLATVLAPGSASAHAQLTRSDPSPGSVLPAPPEVMQLWFSEPLEPAYSKVEVLDARRQRVDAGSSIAPDDPTSMIVRLGEVGPGAYTVVWQTLSTVDGHTARGSFIIAFGSADQIGAVAAGAVDGGQELYPIAVGARWLTLLGMSLLLGSIAFQRFIWRPASRGATGAVGKIDGVVASRCQTVFWIGLALSFVGQVGLFIAQVESLGVGSAEAISVLVGTRSGLFLLARVGLLALIAVAVVLAWPGMALALGGGLLLTLPLAGHAAASSYLPEVSVVMDWLHLAATVVWAGGLPVLAVVAFEVIRRTDPALRNRLLGQLAARFSSIGLVSVALLVATGLWASWAHVGAVEALVQSLYGQALTVKLAAVALVVAVAAVNLLVIRPQLVATAAAGGSRRSANDAAADAPRRWFPRLVIIEGVIVVVILLLAGALTTWTPAIQDPAVILGEPNRIRAAADNYDLELAIQPNRAAENRIVLFVRDLRRQPATDIARAKVDLTLLSQNLGTTEVLLSPDGDGRFSTRTYAISMVGNWRADIVLNQQNGDEIRTSVQFEVPDGPVPQVARPEFVFPGLTTGVIVALEAIVGGIVLVGASRFLRRRNPGIARALVAPAVIVSLLGVGLLARESMVTPTYAAVQNPFPNDPESVARGRVIFEQNCVACHGIDGRGDGPLAASLRPRPLDLREHVNAHPEAELYGFISNGVPGTAMPAWEGQLSAEERWDVLNYIVEAFGE